MNKACIIFMRLVSGVGLLGFGAGIYAAGAYTLSAMPEDMPAVVSYFVSAVNGTPAANLGAILGINIISPFAVSFGVQTTLTAVRSNPASGQA